MAISHGHKDEQTKDCRFGPMAQCDKVANGNISVRRTGMTLAIEIMIIRGLIISLVAAGEIIAVYRLVDDLR